MLRASGRAFLGFLFVALVLAGKAHAAAVVETLTGEAKAGTSLTRTTAIAKGQRIEAGNYIITGAKSLLVLGFDDGQKMVLNENTQFRITGYTFNQNEPKKDKFSFDLLKGALRSITSLFARRNPNAYALRTPQATIGIRGTDFMVASVNPLWGQVLAGQIAATSGPGTAAFGVGAFTVPSSAVLGTVIPLSALPPAVAAQFAQMQALAISVGAGGAGAAGAAAGALSPALIAIPLIAIPIAVGAGDGDGESGTSGTTGTTSP